MLTEMIYRDRDNEIVLSCAEDRSPFDLDDAGITKVDVRIDDEIVSSAIKPDEITWSGVVITLKLGKVLPAGIGDGLHDGRIVVYADDWTNGLVWSELKFRIK